MKKQFTAEQVTRTPKQVLVGPKVQTCRTSTRPSRYREWRPLNGKRREGMPKRALATVAKCQGLDQRLTRRVQLRPA